MRKITKVDAGIRTNRLTTTGIMCANRFGQTTYQYVCDCGNLLFVVPSRVKSGHTKSCGCLKDVSHRKTHGMSRTKIYKLWCEMKRRCLNEKSQAYYNYGGRGIRVSEEWMNFDAFYADMGEPPFGYTLDRIDTNGNYEKENCRWADRLTQACNTRKNKYVLVNGKELVLSEAARELGVPYKTFHYRIQHGFYGNQINTGEANAH